jgi:S-formylglutathione hydrolase
MKTLSEIKAFGGTQGVYRHASDSCHCDMTFGLFLPAQARDGPILIDTGTADPFIDLLRPEALAAAIAERRQQANLRLQPGYDHSYFFVATFMQEHIAFHARALWA